MLHLFWRSAVGLCLSVAALAACGDDGERSETTSRGTDVAIAGTVAGDPRAIRAFAYLQSFVASSKGSNVELALCASLGPDVVRATEERALATVRRGQVASVSHIESNADGSQTWRVDFANGEHSTLIVEIAEEDDGGSCISGTSGDVQVLDAVGIVSPAS